MVAALVVPAAAFKAAFANGVWTGRDPGAILLRAQADVAAAEAARRSVLPLV